MNDTDRTPESGEENVVTAEETPSRYPYLVSVRGGRPVPARKDGRYFVTAYQTRLGCWWPPADVTVLQYDPHRDFYQEIRRAHDETHRTPDAEVPATSQVDDSTIGRQPEDGQGRASRGNVPGPRVVERVDTLPRVERPLPVSPTPPRPRGWGR